MTTLTLKLPAFLRPPAEPPSYALARWLFLRLLGLIYLVAFLSFNAQSMGLLGAHGIAPAAPFVARVRAGLGPGGFWRLPGVFWFDASDGMLRAVGIAGIVCALLLAAGVAQRLTLVLLYILYLSVMQAGQTFWAYQWDILLTEAGFAAIFFAPGNWLPASPEREGQPPRVFLWLLWLIVARLMFSSGYAKLASHDTTWRDLTAMSYHFMTQPMPNAMGYVFYFLPDWFHKLSTLLTLIIEIVLPFLVIAPRPFRYAAAGGFAALMGLIMLTGNFTFFNLLALALTLPLLDDGVWRHFAPGRVERLLAQAASQATQSIPRWRQVGGAAVAGLLVLLQSITLWTQFSPVPLPRPAISLAQAAAPLRVANRYALFAVMTTSRPVVVIEGSDDGETWLPYEFRCATGDPAGHLCQVAPFQPRLDWQMWFAALGPRGYSPWFDGLVVRLLQGEPDVVALLADNPFPDQPPRYIRAVLYDYRFNTPRVRRASGELWSRAELGIYYPPVSLDDFSG